MLSKSRVYFLYSKDQGPSQDLNQDGDTTVTQRYMSENYFILKIFSPDQTIDLNLAEELYSSLIKKVDQRSSSMQGSGKISFPGPSHTLGPFSSLSEVNEFIEVYLHETQFHEGHLIDIRDLNLAAPQMHNLEDLSQFLINRGHKITLPDYDQKKGGLFSRLFL